MFSLGWTNCRPGNLDHRKRCDHRDVAEAIDQKARAFSHGRDQYAANRWSQEPRCIHHRRVEGNRIR
jgi:hypothetical protein